MKDKVLISLVIILSLALFVETAYLLQVHFDNAKSSLRDKFYSYGPSEEHNLFWRFKPFRYEDQYDTFDIFKEMERTQERINKLLKDNFMPEFNNDFLDKGFYGSDYLFRDDTEIKETTGNYIVKLKLPGMEKEKINVELQGNYLVISGEHKSKKDKKGDDGFYTQSQNFNVFRRVIPLPGEVKASGVKTEYKDDTLIVTLPKTKPGKTPKVEVQI